MTGAKKRGLSANELKIIGAISMTVDHAGVLLFPNVPVLRIIGRLAMPIFAWFIAEGMRRTRSPLRYFLRVFILAVACQIPYLIFERDLYFGILFTFSFSILLMWLLRRFFEREGDDEKSRRARLLYSAAFAASAFILYLLCTRVKIDYGYFGIMLPVSAFLFRGKKSSLIAFSVTLAAMSVSYLIELSPASAAALPGLILNKEPQLFSLLAIPLLAFYSGERGKLRMKYFFYIFYPAHLIVLWAISLIV